MIAALLSALPACSSKEQTAATSSGGGGASSGSGQGGASTSSAGGAGGAPVAPQPGLRAEYYAGYMDPVLELYEPTLEHDWTDGAPGDG